MCQRPIRRTQIISPFGVGAMVDFPGPVTLIHAGLDAWQFDEGNHEHKEFKIVDEYRLAKRLNVNFFVKPMDFRTKDKESDYNRPNLYLTLPFLRFPKWHVCPRCGLMYESALHDKSSPRCTGPIGTGKGKGEKHTTRRTHQVRFIASCMNGHLMDIPWWEFLFKTPNPEIKGRLRMITSGSASLAGVKIVCEQPGEKINVIQSTTLAGMFFYKPGEPSLFSNIGIYCNGQNPSLSIPSSNYSAPGCGKDIYPLLKGSSNVYFPKVVSSIYIPPKNTKLNDDELAILEDSFTMAFFKMYLKSDKTKKLKLDTVRNVLNEYHPEKNVEIEKFTSELNKILSGTTVKDDSTDDKDKDETEYRRDEYRLFLENITEGRPKTNLLVEKTNIDHFDEYVKTHIESISLVHKLRETRAFVGYSRILPENDMTPEEMKSMLSHDVKNWLPAIEVRGEGLFIKLREEKITSWLEKNYELLEKRINLIRNNFGNNVYSFHAPTFSAQFVFLHTLAHILINQLIYECGYGSSSLRERLYCDTSDDKMLGILIYTAAGDSEGTMGGLVRMGKPESFGKILFSALEKAKWCSTDPVCIESLGQGSNNCNLAACHSCILLPETSCEEFNRFLDRGLLVGTLTHPDLGYFE